MGIAVVAFVVCLTFAAALFFPTISDRITAKRIRRNGRTVLSLDELLEERGRDGTVIINSGNLDGRCWYSSGEVDGEDRALNAIMTTGSLVVLPLFMTARNLKKALSGSIMIYEFRSVIRK